MSTATSSVSQLDMPLPIHRFSVKQYHQMGELGVLTPEDRVELLEGWIVDKMNQRPIHGFAVGFLNDWLQSFRFADRVIRCQLPITTQFSEPEPDLAIVSGQHSDYRERHPSGQDCQMLVEVADTSLAKDRTKAAIYASAGVAEYWIVNLVDNQLERHRDSDGTRYQRSEVFGSTQTIDANIGDTVVSLELNRLFAN